MRFGLIGLGAAGQSHLDVLAQIESIEVAGIADLNPESVRRMAAQYSIERATTEPEELITDESIEVIAIAAADRAHYPLVLAAAAAGKHVICEKPLATRVDHGREMVAAIAAAEKLFCITFNNRAGQVTRRIREVVRAGAIGQVRMLRLVGLMAQPDHRLLREQIGEAAARARCLNICIEGKNALFDCGVHSFDYARHLTGSDFKRIEAMGFAMRGFDAPDHGVALCEHEDGTLSLIEKSFVYAYEAQTRKEYVRYEVIGDGGSLAWDLDTQTLKVYGRNETVSEPLGHGGKMEVRGGLYRGFVESVERGELLDWLASGEDGLKAIEAAQTALDSMLEKGIVKRNVGDAENWFGDLDSVLRSS